MDNKTFITGLARKLGIATDNVDQLTDALIAAIKNSACNLDSVAIPGFGRFDTVKSDEYIAVDKADGINKLFPPTVSMSFTPGSMLKKRLSHE